MDLPDDFIEMTVEAEDGARVLITMKKDRIIFVEQWRDAEKCGVQVGDPMLGFSVCEPYEHLKKRWVG